MNARNRRLHTARAMQRIRHGAAALRMFVQGFVGVAGATIAPPAAGDPKLDARGTRRTLEQTAARRGRCC